MVSAVVLLLLAQGPDLAKPVTYTARAERAATLLPKLGSAIGVPLEAGASVADEILAVAVQDVPAGKLLERIAKVASAEWKPTASGFRLGAAAGVREREAAAARAAALADLKKLIANQREQMAAALGEVSATEKKEFLDQVPLEPCMQVLPFVDLAPIANLRPGERVVFATRPNQMQLPIAPSAGKALDQLVKQHNFMAQEDSSDPVDLGDAEMSPEIRRMLEAERRRRTSKIEGPIAKALLVAQRDAVTIGAQLTLKLLDAKGNIVLSETSFLFDSALLSKTSAQKTGGTKIPLRKESEEYGSAFVGMGASGFSGGKLGPEQWKLVSRPDVYEPLSFGATDRVFALAASKGLPIVACLPDSMFASRFGMDMGVGTLEELAKDLREGNSARWIEDAEFMLVMPAKPTLSREDRVNRPALAKLLSSVQSGGLASLDDLAAYAVAVANPSANPLSASFLLNFVPGSITSGLSGLLDWDMVRFYGHITPGQAAALANGSISLGALSPAQRQILGRMVYGANRKLRPNRPGEPAPSTDPFSMGLSMFSSRDRDYLDEPTEALPQGIPLAGRLEVRTEQTAVFVPEAADNPVARMMGVMGPDEVAMVRFTAAALPAEAASFMPKFGKGRLGNRREMTFNFLLTPQLGLTDKLNDNRIPANAPVANFDAMPEAFEKRVQARLEALRKSPLAGIQDSLSRRNAPPP